MSSSEGPVEMEEGSSSLNASEDPGSAAATAEGPVEMEEGSSSLNASEDPGSATAAASAETGTVLCPPPQRERASSSQNSQVSETVVPETASSSGAACDLSEVDDDILTSQSATNAILQELELMRPTYIFSEAVVRAAGRTVNPFFPTEPSFLGGYSTSSDSEEDSDSCLSPPASRTSMRRIRMSAFYDVVECRTVVRTILPDDELRPNTTPNHRRRRPNSQLAGDGHALFTGFRRHPPLFRI